MARLDAIVDKLFREGGTEIAFQTGQAALMATPRGPVPVIQTPLSSPQIIGALVEIVPGELQHGFPTEGTTNFAYVAPAGRVDVVIDRRGPLVRARVTPAPGAPPPPQGRPALELDLGSDAGGEMELVSPHELLGLAAANNGAAAVPDVPSPRGNGKARAVEAPRAEAQASPSVPVHSAAARAAMDALLKTMLARKASDLHLTSGMPPMLRIDGDMVAIEGQAPLTPPRLKEMLWSIAGERYRNQWEELKDTDFAHETPDARFRVNVFADRNGIGSVMRQIPNSIMTAEGMGLSKHILDLCFLTKGLVLVTGPTGSGKSTTLAAMVDYINRHRSDHLITIEDPIEFVHPNKQCLVNQREIGVHTSSFKHALRAALREDPDVVLVGEMRDLETIAIAIETAETGHLVFGTLHTNTAPSTVDRIIDQFPADRQSQIRLMLSESLKGVISQTLCKKIGGGRAPAQEVLICNSGVANLIREGKTFQIPSIMQTGKAHGMVTLNDALFDLVKRKVVEPKEAYMKAVAKTEFKAMLEKTGIQLDLTGT